MLYKGTGELVALARGIDRDGNTVWREARQPGGGEPTQPLRNTEELTPQALLIYSRNHWVPARARTSCALLK